MERTAFHLGGTEDFTFTVFLAEVSWFINSSMPTTNSFQMMVKVVYFKFSFQKRKHIHAVFFKSLSMNTPICCLNTEFVSGSSE